MRKWFRYFLKSLTWTLTSWFTTYVVVTICVNDPTFTFVFALMLSFLITCVSTAAIPAYMLHEWMWEPTPKIEEK